MALSRTLPAFAAERRLKAPAAIDRYLLQTPALSSKPLLLSIDGRQTDGRMDARPLHRPCSAHYAGSISNVHCRTLRQADTLVYADDEQGRRELLTQEGGREWSASSSVVRGSYRRTLGIVGSARHDDSVWR